ncbi:hypothetical protein ElyMa_003641200 [Elysia marginata]|uniref:Uncharacterized protein n=1 Tax=Elysia marginata TaxID=1093978 RepID=A0AAV4EUU3_9GAST|nr:hypothetical protein ElyMa_003641200 [Elysia marginata]
MKFFQVGLALCLVVALVHGQDVDEAEEILTVLGITSDMTPDEIFDRATQLAAIVNKALDHFSGHASDTDANKLKGMTSRAITYLDSVLDTLDSLDKDELYYVSSLVLVEGEQFLYDVLESVGINITAATKTVFKDAVIEIMADFEAETVDSTKEEVKEIVLLEVQQLKAIINKLNGYLVSRDVTAVAGFVQSIKQKISDRLAGSQGKTYDEFKDGIHDFLLSVMTLIFNADS